MDRNATLPSMHRVCTSLTLQSRDPKVLLDSHFSLPRSMLTASSVSDVFANNMWTLSVFASLRKRFQGLARCMPSTAFSGSRSLSAKSTSSVYFRVELGGLGLVVENV